MASLPSQRAFQRNYQLIVDAEYNNPTGPQILIQPPFSLEFMINRNTLSSVNDASFRIYNLQRTVRDKIFKDSYNHAIYKGVELRAGYGSSLPVIFRGNMSGAFSARENVNYITSIDAQDGGVASANSHVDISMTANVTEKVQMQRVIETMKAQHINPGVISDSFTDSSKRGVVLSGSSKDVLASIASKSGGGAFIDLETINVLGANEALQGAVEEITPSIAILSTPVREEHFLRFDILFEPRLIAGQYIRLKSFTENRFNSEYKLVSLQHRGVISEAMAGDAITTVGLWYGTKAIKKL